MSAERPPVLLLGSGRCGSTLVQRILNTSPEICMWGEHNGVCRHLSQAWFSLTDHHLIKSAYYDQRVYDPDTVLGPSTKPGMAMQWVNDFQREDVNEAFRLMIRRLFAERVDTSRAHWGFKEIRYRLKEPFMPMWQELFPETKFLFVTRHPAAVVRSMFKSWKLPQLSRFDAEEIRQYFVWATGLWLETNEAIIKWHQDPAVDSWFMRFEDLEKSPAHHVKEMFEFLGVNPPRTALKPLKKKLSNTRTRAISDAIAEAMQAGDRIVRRRTGEIARSLGYDFD